MGPPVVHFEIIGKDPAKLRGYYGELFAWEFNTGDAVSEKVSQPGMYGFVDGSTTGEGNGINGGVGGGPGLEPRVLFYVGVPDVESALQNAERLGGKRLMGPDFIGAPHRCGRQSVGGSDVNGWAEIAVVQASRRLSRIAPARRATAA